MMAIIMELLNQELNWVQPWPVVNLLRNVIRFSGVNLKGCEKMSGSEAEEEADLSAGGVDDEGRNKMGSRPPSCEHKCLGCMPCEAIQMPTTTARVGVQYANYEPEFWKCKCGPSFYSP
ncbi:hypothetical protein U1Q18_006443 [Sarracenia purpurea var. burkii]